MFSKLKVQSSSYGATAVYHCRLPQTREGVKSAEMLLSHTLLAPYLKLLHLHKFGLFGANYPRRLTSPIADMATHGLCSTQASVSGAMCGCELYATRRELTRSQVVGVTKSSSLISRKA